MSDPGPTSVGSINARLTLDADQFERDMTRAGEQADRLDGRNINVDVNARGTTAALLDIERLQMAERRLQAAELDLDAVQRRRGSTQQQILRAQNAVSAATLNYDTVQRRVRQSMEERRAAEEAAATTTAAASSATDDATRHVNAFGESQQGANTALRVFIALSPLALAAAATLAAGATGLASGFGVMAAAGVAAIAGIKTAMQDGTATGQVYTAGLAELKTGLTLLEQTGAQAFLAGFSQATDTANRAMPVFNQYVSEGAAALGTMGANLVTGLVTGLERAQPLIQAGTVGLQQFVGWLAQMSQTDGFEQFVAYAVNNLPAVVQFLESLVTVAGRLVAAFAPLGPAVLGSLQFLTDVINNLPLPVLAALTTMIVALPASLSLARAAVATFGQTAALQALNVTVFGTAINLAVPVVGILTAALAALTIGIAASASGQQQAIVSANEYADALERDGNKIGEYTTKLAVKKLADEGAYDAVSKLGLGQDTLTKAVTGSSDALKIVQSAIDQANGAYSTAAQNSRASGLKIKQSILDQKAAADLLGPALNQNLQAIQQQQHANEMYASASQGALQADQAKAAQAGLTAAALGVTTDALRQAQDAQQKNADSAAQATLQMQLENNAAGLLKGALDTLNGTSLSAAQAQNAFDSSLANMGTHVDKVGKQITFTTANIGDMSAASVALRGQLNGQVAAAEQTAEAFGQMSNSSEAGRQKLIDLRAQIIDNAVAHGVDRDAVTAYIDKVLQIPASVPPTKIEADTAQAEANIARVQNMLATLHDRVINVSVRQSVTGVDGGEHSGGALMVPQALGGWAGGVGYMAAGGTVGPWSRGTDMYPTVLAHQEFVVNRPAATTLERDHPGALDYMNRTGKLPTQQQAPAAVPVFPDQVTLLVDGHAFTAYVDRRADARIGAAVRDAAGTRIGVN